MMIRELQTDDLRAVTEIYAQHVLTGTGSFEESPPDEAAMQARMDALVVQGYPRLVAERDGQVLGYAYAGPHKARSAYRFTVEDSIYVAPDAAGCGVGSLLLGELVSRCREAGYQQMMAVIGDSANAASIGLHIAHGFRHVGVAKGLGYKFGRWLDIVYMQRGLGES